MSDGSGRVENVITLNGKTQQKVAAAGRSLLPEEELQTIEIINEDIEVLLHASDAPLTAYPPHYLNHHSHAPLHTT